MDCRSKEIGAAFGVGRFAVSKAAAMIERELAVNRDLSSLVSRLRAALRRDRL